MSKPETAGRDVRRESVPAAQVKATSTRLKAEVKAAGYSVLTLARENLDTGFCDVLVVPFRQQDSPERMAELVAQIEALAREGFRSLAGGDDVRVTAAVRAPIDPIGLAFSSGD